MTKAYFFMFIAIFCEVCGTLLLPSTQNFTKIIPTAIAVGTILVKFCVEGRSNVPATSQKIAININK